MYGCPNRCKHCWLGSLPNKLLDDSYPNKIVELFKPYFKDITFYSWLREPDNCKNYIDRWIEDNNLSTIKPVRFELASFYKIARDINYVKWLKEVGTKKVQLTFFGLEDTTDLFIGRKGAYKELIKASDILKENGIEPRWQIFIYQSNISEVVELISIAKQKDIKEILVHEGSCDGNNRLLYPIRINKDEVIDEIKPYYLDYSSILSEKECFDILIDDESSYVPHNEGDIVIYITSDLNIYFNFTNPSKSWKIGNILTENIEDIVNKIINEDIPALNIARKIKIKDLVKKYGDFTSNKVFSLDDYKMYLLNNYLAEIEEER